MECVRAPSPWADAGREAQVGSAGAEGLFALAPATAEVLDRTHDGGVGEGGVGFAEAFAQPFFGRFTRLIGFGLIEVVGPDGHVGKDRDVVAGDLGKPGPDGEVMFFALAAHHDFARDNLGHEGDVLGVDAHLALDAGQGDHLDFLGAGLALGGHDFEFEGGGHVRRNWVRGPLGEFSLGD